MLSSNRRLRIAELVVWVLAAYTAESLVAPHATVTTDLNSLTPSATPSTSAPSSSPFTATLDLKDSAERCWSSWASYASAQSVVEPEYSYTTLGIYPTWVETTCCFPTWDSVPMTTLCDGFPRALGFPTTVWNITSTQTFYNYTSLSFVQSPHTEVVPICSINNEGSDCTRLWSSWDYTYTSLKSASNPASELYGDDSKPPCTSPLKACPTALTACSIDADDVTMYYWPVTTASGGDFCAHNGTILTPRPTDKSGRTNTVKSGSMIFTSPSVYIVASSAYAWYETRQRGYTTWGQRCGTADIDFIYAVDPASISTIDPHTPDVLYPLDWQDLNTVRHDAYERECPRRYGCSYFSIIVSDFTPFVKMPLGVNTMQDQWKGCSGQGIFYPQFVRLGESVTTGLGIPHTAAAIGEEAKPTRPASNRHAKSTRTVGANGPGSTPTGDYPRIEVIEEIRVIVLDNITPDDAEEL